jgi:alpha-amylase
MTHQTLFQFFHWYISPDQNLWREVDARAKILRNLGITDVWLPPAFKSEKGEDEPGYAVYDLFDLGEFD